MKATETYLILCQMDAGEITLKEAHELILDLFSVSKCHLLESILEDMDGKHPEYHREVVKNYLDDGC